MNLVLYRKEERDESGCVFIQGERAEYLSRVRNVQIGDIFRVGEIDGVQAEGRVIEALPSGVRLEIVRSYPDQSSAITENEVSIIVAASRPQMMKRIFSTAAAYGVRQVAVIGSKRVEKSYFHSPVLAPEGVRHYLELGMEQGMKTRLPTVRVIPRFGDFLTTEIATESSENEVRLVAEPRAKTFLSLPVGQKKHVLFAVGPEGGWDEAELEAFSELNFEQVSLGGSLLRVETAVTAALAQLELLRILSPHD